MDQYEYNKFNYTCVTHYPLMNDASDDFACIIWYLGWIHQTEAFCVTLETWQRRQGRFSLLIIFMQDNTKFFWNFRSKWYPNKSYFYVSFIKDPVSWLRRADLISYFMWDITISLITSNAHKLPLLCNKWNILMSYIFENCNLCYLMQINKKYLKHSEIDTNT